MTSNLIHVAAAAIEDDQGRILITKRHDEAHQGGLWEFPGGKLEIGETAEQALERELHEELDITPIRPQSLITVRHQYPDCMVRLDVFHVIRYSGTPKSMEGQPMDWQHPESMQVERFPAADRPIVNALRLPERYLITGADPFRREEFLDRLEMSLSSGLRLVQLRAHELPDEAYRSLTEEAVALCRQYNARLLLNRPQHPERWIGLADGLHLTSHQLMSMQQRLPGTAWLGASCHDPAELDQAESLGLDYVLLSPVCPTRSHPNAEPLGWERFSQWVDRVNLPVFALGGLTMEDLPLARQMGAQGIAGISGYWPG